MLRNITRHMFACVVALSTIRTSVTRSRLSYICDVAHHPYRYVNERAGRRLIGTRKNKGTKPLVALPDQERTTGGPAFQRSCVIRHMPHYQHPAQSLPAILRVPIMDELVDTCLQFVACPLPATAESKNGMSNDVDNEDDAYNTFVENIRAVVECLMVLRGVDEVEGVALNVSDQN